MEAVKVANAAKARERETAALLAVDRSVTDSDTTYAANATTATGMSSNKSGSLPKKKVIKAKLSAKEKKERIVRETSCLSFHCLFSLYAA
jgi:butyrate kinase